MRNMEIIDDPARSTIELLVRLELLLKEMKHDFKILIEFLRKK